MRNLGIALSRNEMRNISAGVADGSGGGVGIDDGYHKCGIQLDCRFQSPAWTCGGGIAPTCKSRFCTKPEGGTSIDYQFGCGQG